MDSERIQKLAEEVLSQLGPPVRSEEVHDLEARVAALEKAVFSGTASPGSPTDPASVTVATATQVLSHPSQHLLRVLGGTKGEPCILEPDKPCVHSGRCRALGF